jgi:hypothetical protein
MAILSSAKIDTYFICLSLTRWDADTSSLVECRRIVPTNSSACGQVNDGVPMPVRYCTCGSKYKKCYGLLAIAEDIHNHVYHFRINVMTQESSYRSQDPVITQDYAPVIAYDSTAHLYIQHMQSNRTPVIPWQALITIISGWPQGVIMSAQNRPRFSPYKCALCAKRFSKNNKLVRRAAKCRGYHWSVDKQAHVQCPAWMCRFNNECARAGDPCSLCHSIKPVEMAVRSAHEIVAHDGDPTPRWHIPLDATRYILNGVFTARWITEV